MFLYIYTAPLFYTLAPKPTKSEPASQPNPTHIPRRARPVTSIRPLSSRHVIHPHRPIFSTHARAVQDGGGGGGGDSGRRRRFGRRRQRESQRPLGALKRHSCPPSLPLREPLQATSFFVGGEQIGGEAVGMLWWCFGSGGASIQRRAQA
jgi:hypothetical protein